MTATHTEELPKCEHTTFTQGKIFINSNEYRYLSHSLYPQKANGHKYSLYKKGQTFQPQFGYIVWNERKTKWLHHNKGLCLKS